MKHEKHRDALGDIAGPAQVLTAILAVAMVVSMLGWLIGKFFGW